MMMKHRLPYFLISLTLGVGRSKSEFSTFPGTSLVALAPFLYFELRCNRQHRAHETNAVGPCRDHYC